MAYEEELKVWIRNSEERFISYKKQLEEVHKNKAMWPPEDEFTIWFKADLRDSKNMEEANLKRLIEEKTYLPGETPSSSARWLADHAMKRGIKNLQFALDEGLKNDKLAPQHETIKQLLMELNEKS